MVQYNPKDWLTFVFRIHKSDTFRKLFPMMVTIGIYSAAICYIELEYYKLNDKSLVKNISMMHSMLGFVISLLLAYRTNTAYERWWEGRKLWGSLVNNSRNFAIKLSVILKEDKDKKVFRKLIPAFASVLKKSPYTKNYSFEQVYSLAQSATDPANSIQQEFLKIIQKAIKVYVSDKKKKKNN